MNKQLFAEETSAIASFSSYSWRTGCNPSGIAVVVVGTLGVVAGVVWLTLRWWHAGRENKETSIKDEELEEGKGPRRFSYLKLARATRNFSQDQKFGK